jgi:hypothetical protein
MRPPRMAVQLLAHTACRFRAALPLCLSTAGNLIVSVLTDAADGLVVIHSVLLLSGALESLRHTAAMNPIYTSCTPRTYPQLCVTHTTVD